MLIIVKISFEITILLNTGVLVDVSDQVGNNANYSLPIEALTDWETKNGPLPEKVVVLVKSGWGSKYFNKREYLGPSDHDLRFPGLSKQAAEWLASTKKVIHFYFFQMIINFK